MDKRLKALLQKRADLQKEAAALFEQSEAAGEATLSEEATQRLAKIESETTEINAEVARIERHLERERDLAATSPWLDAGDYAVPYQTVSFDSAGSGNHDLILRLNLLIEEYHVSSRMVNPWVETQN